MFLNELLCVQNENALKMPIPLHRLQNKKGKNSGRFNFLIILKKFYSLRIIFRGFKVQKVLKLLISLLQKQPLKYIF